MQGGLQSITNTTIARAQAATQPTITVKTEAAMPVQDARHTKTPSPKKALAAPGKENVNTTTPEQVA